MDSAKLSGQHAAMANPLARRPELDRTIVELLAVAYESLTRTELVGALAKLGVRTLHGKRLDTKSINPVVESLAAAGFITYQGRLECASALRETLARKLAAEGRFEPLADAISSVAVMLWGRSGWERAIREVRHAVYTNDPDRVFELLARYESAFGRSDALAAFCVPFDAWLDAYLDARIRIEVLTQIAARSIPDVEPAEDAFTRLDEALRAGSDATVEQHRIHVEQLLLRGRVEDAEPWLQTGKHPAETALKALMQGDRDAAIAGFERVSKPPGTRQRSWVIPGIGGLLYALALATSKDESHRARARKLIDTAERDHVPFQSGYREIEGLLDFRRHGVKDSDYHTDYLPCFDEYNRASDIDRWIAVLVHSWTREKMPTEMTQWLDDAAGRADKAGYAWIAVELADLLARSKTSKRKRADAMREKLNGPTQPLGDLLVVKPAWERKLELLCEISAPKAPVRKASVERPSAESRLAWIVSVEHGWLHLEPRHQTCDAKGKWSKGRKIALKRLFERDPELDFLTDLDRQICGTIECDTSPGWGRHVDITYSLSGPETYKLLAGHPAIFRSADDPTPVELVFTEPRLIVSEEQGQMRLAMYPKQARGDYTVVEDGPYRIEVCELTEAQRQVAKVLDGEAVVPSTARARVEATIAALTPLLTVQSDVASAPDVGAASAVPVHDLIYLQLTRRGLGLEARLQAFPLGREGPACRAGQGQRLVVGLVDGRRLQAERNLKREQDVLDVLTRSCPSLALAAAGPATWRFEDIESALGFLLDLDRTKELGIRIEWTDDNPLELSPELDESSLELTVGAVSGGYALGGNLRIGKARQVPLSELLGLLADSPARFVQLSDGRFLALTQVFRRRLEEVSRYVQGRRGKTQLLPALAASAVQPLIDAAGSAKTDARWNEQMARIHAAEALEVTIPSTLKAELRVYQEEGFRWMARLAAWGAGACLADDMGLGKTVQALAVILLRASAGPTLIVAPTSVCANWETEAVRFAPTLHPIGFGGDDRRRIIEALGPRDLLITSYSLLHREAPLLAKVDWATIVLDEAQAIKNPRTERFKAAIRLRGDFRLVTTGTPIENRLEELWSLFHFVNPGLLGTRDDFEKRFSVPIERFKDSGARVALRKLVRPYILRRNKSQVLEDLPARSEINMKLEMGTSEAALYETLRQQALEELAATSRNGAAPLKVLAWITKLRRTCCNPRLVVEGKAPDSCKLAAFAELVEELRGSGHKALVFSQFVDHLAILRPIVISNTYQESSREPRT
ncbi:MAG: DEAD/DEAH box helicase [Myxococcota bacterium]